MVFELVYKENDGVERTTRGSFKNMEEARKWWGLESTSKDSIEVVSFKELN